jgi:glycerophosphoryl diester phosphodiesterase
MKFIAYKGHSVNTPPNSNAAIKTALENDVDGIYLDVNYTKDECLVCNGESDNSIISILGLTSSYNLDEIKKVDLGEVYGARYKGERILKLTEAISLIDEKKEIFLGLASGSRRFPNIEERVLDLLEENNLIERASIVSLDHLALKWLKKMNSSLRTYAMHYARFAKPVDFAMDVMADGIASYYYLLTSFVIEASHRELLDVIAFPINNSTALNEMNEIGVDIIFSPDTKLIQELKDKGI